jgi:hypothetical protein
VNRAERRRQERRQRQTDFRNRFDEAVGAVTYQSIDSGVGVCEDCNSGLEMKKDKFGTIHAVVKHDDECPWYNQWLESKENK